MLAPIIAALLATTNHTPADKAIFPFPSPLLTVAAVAGGGGGGGGDTRFYHAGQTVTNGTNTTGFAANLCAMSPITPTANGNVYAVCLRQQSNAVGVKMKAVIYSDNAGQPGNLLATGIEVTLDNGGVDISLPLATPFAVTSGTKYWAGAISNGSVNCEGTTGGINTLWWYTGSYASPAATAPAMSHNGNQPVAYFSIGDSTAAGSTGFISNQQGVFSGNTVRCAFGGDRAPNDIAFLHVTFINTSGAPAWVAPAGWTLILEHAIGGAGNYRELLYWRRIDGTECWPSTGVTTANTGSLMINASIWRGYTASGTPYEAFTSTGGTNTNPSGSTITTLGANRTVINFYSQSLTTALGNANANGWADKYNDTAAGAGGCLAACSMKDVAVAGSVTAEARTEASQWWECFTLALIKA